MDREKLYFSGAHCTYLQQFKTLIGSIGKVLGSYSISPGTVKFENSLISPIVIHPFQQKDSLDARKAFDNYSTIYFCV